MAKKSVSSQPKKRRSSTKAKQTLPKERKGGLVYDFPGLVRGGTPKDISVKELRRRLQAGEPVFNPDLLPEGLVYQTNRVLRLPDRASRIIFITRFRVRTIYRGELVEGIARRYAPVGRYGEPSFLIVIYMRRGIVQQRWVPAEAVEVIGDQERGMDLDPHLATLTKLHDKYREF